LLPRGWFHNFFLALDSTVHSRVRSCHCDILLFLWNVAVKIESFVSDQGFFLELSLTITCLLKISKLLSLSLRENSDANDPLCTFSASEGRFVAIARDCCYSQGKVRIVSFSYQLRGYWGRFLAFAAYVQITGKILRSRIFRCNILVVLLNIILNCKIY
jgi:hypothetical protein